MNRFTIPRDIYYGEGALEVLQSLDGKKAALVIGGGSVKENGNLNKIEEHLSKANIETKVIEGITEEPSTNLIQEQVSILNDFQPDWIIGIGGGSPMDAAKAMWIWYEHPELPFDEAKKLFNLPELRKKAKFIGIPTTSGTASEISNLSVITDSETGVKHPIADFGLTPDFAVIDPIMVDDMPPKVIAYSGMDAVTHSIEAYVAKLRTTFTDSLSIEAAEILNDHLIASYEGNKESREKVHYAQAMAGMAFANAVLGNVHSMAHKSGPTFDVPHGCANGIYLPYVIQFNRSVVGERFAKIAKRLELQGETTEELVDSLIEWVRSLNRAMGVPNTLKDFGVSEELFKKHVDEMAKNAMDDPCTSTNPRETSEDEMKKLFEAAYYGEDVTF
ncbi:NADPH-dependent butanol dehydrogenase [Pontibacillus halophilus JSM 076056 = DSM 19796]|uniref:NADPH-dependent butanol dehydrogenase n=1 Tax=Pontibacillus halophilus JSM 076056 = DSM 19796 TaxID=1385510 RepID=A0A0A5GCG7_9BACI|nr:iron-containing alcohol dehydrogenase [Pontibacillus halophilus]KGX89714.1 NADPH-dependent butanol dehydrogenase [Pontibacillus halophilus JSM 076056 = DSM 19796]